MELRSDRGAAPFLDGPHVTTSTQRFKGFCVCKAPVDMEQSGTNNIVALRLKRRCLCSISLLLQRSSQHSSGWFADTK